MNAWDPTPVATVAQFEDGLIRMRDNYGIPAYGLEIFRAFAVAPTHADAADAKLANALGCKDAYANRSIGNLSTLLQTRCTSLRPVTMALGDPRWWPLIAYSSSEVEDQWTLRPEAITSARKFALGQTIDNSPRISEIACATRGP